MVIDLTYNVSSLVAKARKLHQLSLRLRKNVDTKSLQDSIKCATSRAECLRKAREIKSGGAHA